MSRGLKWFSAVILAIIVSIAALFIVIRTHDGPMEIISGGPFKTGEVVTGITDWSFLKDQLKIEMQTMIPPRSRTMWLVVVDNRLFVVSGNMNSRLGRMWKKWPRTLEQDNRAIVRVDSKLYEFSLVRLETAPIVDRVIEAFNEKYRAGITEEAVNSGAAWFFELKPR